MKSKTLFFHKISKVEDAILATNYPINRLGSIALNSLVKSIFSFNTSSLGPMITPFAKGLPFFYRVRQAIKETGFSSKFFDSICKLNYS